MSEHDMHNDDDDEVDKDEHDNNRREILMASSSPPLSSSNKRPKRPFLQFSGARHTRVGADFQITSLPPCDADAAALPLKTPAVPVEPEVADPDVQEPSLLPNNTAQQSS